MGVDTGKELHVVISRYVKDGDGQREVIYIGTRQAYSELDELMEKFNVRACVIDALPEVHATRDFANRHRGRVWLNYFQESQRGSYHWDRKEWIVSENRTEALDASRQVVRDRKVTLPRGGKLIREFAEHLSADVKQLIENEQTGALTYRYIKTGTNHFSLAFTYDCIAWSRIRYGGCVVRCGTINEPLNPENILIRPL